MTTLFTLFSGGGCVEHGAIDASLTPIGGIEYDKSLASVHTLNFPDAPVTIADVREIDPLSYPFIPGQLHASPSCKNASVANSQTNEDGTKETEFDRECGLAVCRFIDAWQPETFTLENVWQYRNFDAFGYILTSLQRNGYSVDFWRLNSANYGVPQTRKRLILIARRGEWRIQKPVPTHHGPSTFQPDQLNMFEPVTLPWIGWYEAIEDLIPTLPESSFAKWQIERLPDEIKTFLCFSGNTNFAEAHPGKGCCDVNEPSNTIMSGVDRLNPVAFILAQGKYGDDLVKSDNNDPVFTITSNSNQTGLKTFMFNTDNAGRDLSIVDGDTPSITVGALNKNSPKAWLMSDFDGDIRETIEPSHTIRALAIGGTSARAWLSQGRVVKMTPRCLARFQSIPDRAKLTGNDRLDAQWIGNGVPSLLFQRMVESIKG